MKYLIKFWDKHELIVSDKMGEQIKLAKYKKIECIKVGDAFYEMKAISYIEPIKEPQQENLLPEKVENPVKKETIEMYKKQMAEKFNWQFNNAAK